jgi:phosphoribosylformylglycinamidine synthase subunit PurS
VQTSVQLPALEDARTVTFTIAGLRGYSFTIALFAEGRSGICPTESGAKVNAVVYDRSMKARVFVSPKTTVLDPQGQTIRGALHGLGHASIREVRQGKFFDIEVTAAEDREATMQEMDRIARDVLSNPVIEDYRVEFFD